MNCTVKTRHCLLNALYYVEQGAQLYSSHNILFSMGSIYQQQQNQCTWYTYIYDLLYIHIHIRTRRCVLIHVHVYTCNHKGWKSMHYTCMYVCMYQLQLAPVTYGRKQKTVSYSKHMALCTCTQRHPESFCRKVIFI